MRSTDRQLELESVWRIVASIPRGEFLSYGEVARRAGMPRRARWIGRALGEAPAALRLPWHRVMGAGGRISFPPESTEFRAQARRLRAEGVRLKGARVIETVATHRGLDALLWSPAAAVPEYNSKPHRRNSRKRTP